MELLNIFGNIYIFAVFKVIKVIDYFVKNTGILKIKELL